jgi:cytochrome P450
MSTATAILDDAEATARGSQPKLVPVPGPRAPMLVQTAMTMPWLGERFLYKCTEKYGKTFRLQLYWMGEMVITSDLELVRELFFTRKDREPMATWIPDGSLRRMLGENPLTNTDGEEHKVNRRRLSGALSLLVERGSSGPTPLSDDVRATFERLPVGGPHSLWGVIEPVLFESVLRDALGVADPGRRARLRTAFREYHKLGHRPELFDARLQKLIGGRSLRRFEAAERVIREIVHEELANTPAEGFRAGLIELACEWARDVGADEQEMSVEFVKGVVYAGTITTASACVWTLLLLLHHPDLLARVRAELAEGDRTLLGRCEREALRLFPPHTITPLRRLSSPFPWGSQILPGDTVFGVAATLVHRDSSIYEHPNRFMPDRYADGWNPPPHAWLAFGAGLHRCLGQQWGLARATDIVEAVVQHTELAVARPRLEPMWMIQQGHGPRWGGEVMKLGTRPT